MENMQREIADLRVAVGRLELSADHAKSWIDAHRLRMSGVEQATNSRLDTLAKQQVVTDGRLTEIGHHLKTTMLQVSDNRERIKYLETTPKSSSRLEIMLPVYLMVAALALRLSGMTAGEIASLIAK